MGRTPKATVRRLRLITHRHRAPSTNYALGMLLAFNAGAVNAGGFLVLHAYTSHMTGFASQLADVTVLRDSRLALGALGAILAFICGAACCAVIVNWGRRHRLRSLYALPLILEAALLAPFGLMGASMMSWRAPFALPLTVLLLSFIMGLQNAVGSKASGGSIRTTHMTGNITDLGMEIGKAMYWKLSGTETAPVAGARYSLLRMRMAGGLIAMFISGGALGALGFKYVGFVCVVPLAALLLLLSLPPLRRDLSRLRSRIRFGSDPKPSARPNPPGA